MSVHLGDTNYLCHRILYYSCGSRRSAQHPLLRNFSMIWRQLCVWSVDFTTDRICVDLFPFFSNVYIFFCRVQRVCKRVRRKFAYERKQVYELAWCIERVYKSGWQKCWKNLSLTFYIPFIDFSHIFRDVICWIFQVATVIKVDNTNVFF